MAKLKRSFYARPTLLVAKEMLGKYLVVDGQVGRIVETEGYLGPDDLASHARSGPTKRNSLMFGPPGFVYVYMTYGLHFMLNITTEADGVAGAVLIRAIEPVLGITSPTHGPARLTKALGINLSHRGLDITGHTMYLEDRGDPFDLTQGHSERSRRMVRQAHHYPERSRRSDKIGEVVETSRVGIDYAGEFAKKPWRFFLKGNKFVSRV